MSLDKVTEAGELFIGGIFTLRRYELLKKANISHIVSVISQNIEPELVKNYKHLGLNIDDVEYEDILQYFPSSNEFIRQGLQDGGGVFVHCMMGKSRSATLICAYLMHQEPTRTPEIALELLRRYRPMAEPNEGFMEQLDLYCRMGAPDQVENQAIYQRWLFDRIVKESVEAGQAPIDIRFEDEEEPNPESSNTRFTCRKCRRVLASSAYLVSHQQKEVSSTVKALTKFEQPIEALDRTSLETKPISSKRCGHLFLDPLSWMKDELEQGKLEGRLECPKCKSNVGKYAWQGLRCTCNAWIVPGISLSRSRVDELKDLSTTRTAPSVKI